MQSDNIPHPPPAPPPLIHTIPPPPFSIHDPTPPPPHPHLHPSPTNPPNPSSPSSPPHQSPTPTIHKPIHISIYPPPPPPPPSSPDRPQPNPPAPHTLPNPKPPPTTKSPHKQEPRREDVVPPGGSCLQRGSALAASRTSRTLRARPIGLKGFCRNAGAGVDHPVDGGRPRRCGRHEQHARRGPDLTQRVGELTAAHPRHHDVGDEQMDRAPRAARRRRGPP